MKQRVGQNLAPLHGKRIAVIIPIGRDVRVVRGMAVFECHSKLGSVLRIPIEEDEDATDLIISGRNWVGQIVSDNEYDCDFCLIPSPVLSST